MKYSMPGYLFKRIPIHYRTTLSDEAGIVLHSFDEQCVHFNVVDPHKLLIFLLKI